MEEKKGFWSVQPGIAIKGLLWIYGSIIPCTWVLFQWVDLFPLWGPTWFDNIIIMVASLWWVFAFAAAGNWPFSKIKNKYIRGSLMLAASWIIGTLQTYILYWSGSEKAVQFPIIAGLFLFITVFSYYGGNWGFSDASQPRQFAIVIMLCFSLTWVSIVAIGWIPPWWFPIAQLLLGSQMLGYAFRKMDQLPKLVYSTILTFILMAIYIAIMNVLGIYDLTLAGVSAFWKLGYPKHGGMISFFVGCSFAYGILVPIQNWPFRKVRMPWGGILAMAFCSILIGLVSWWLYAWVEAGIITAGQAYAYGYNGVFWSFAYPLGFGVGSETAYLWKGQKTPMTWDDIER